MVTFNVTAGTTTPADQTATVTYTADAQSVNLKYVDDDNNGTSVGDPVTLTGPTDSTKQWTATVPTNYELAAGQAADGSVTFKATNNADIVVHLVHKHQAGTMTTTSTVHYTGLPEPQADQGTPTHWTTNEDLVTGETIYTPDHTVVTIETPRVAGYTPDQQSVVFTTPISMRTPQNQMKVVTYTGEPQTLTIRYVDDVTGLTLSDLQKAIQGTTGQTISYPIQVPRGYVLAVGQTSTITCQLSSDGLQNIATVHLTHMVSHHSLFTTQTVHYYREGTTDSLIPDTTQIIKWAVTVDEVTGEQVGTAQSHYLETPAPAIDGYRATTSGVEASYPGATTRPSDSEAIIYYVEITDNNGIPEGNPGGEPTDTGEPGENPTGGPSDNGGPDLNGGPEDTPIGDLNDGGDTSHSGGPEGAPTGVPVNSNETTGQTGKSAKTVNTNQIGEADTIGSQDVVSATEAKQRTNEQLPQTGNKQSESWTVLGLVMASILTLFGIGKRSKQRF